MDAHGYQAIFTIDQIQSIQNLSPRLTKNSHVLKTNYSSNLPSNLKTENESLEHSLVSSSFQNNTKNLAQVLGDAAHANLKREFDLSQLNRYYGEPETRAGCTVKMELEEQQWTQGDGDTESTHPDSPTVPAASPEYHHSAAGDVVPPEDLKMVKTDKPISTISKSLVTGVFKCYRCQSSFSTCRALRQHAKRCCQSQGCHACPRCLYTCQSASILKIHERVHTGEKPYACKLCDYKSGQKNNVAKHALVHLQEKPYRCRFCEYSAAQKNNLVVHERTHTGDKPYKCRHCDYRTVQKPNLDKHMYLHTDRKPYMCDLCPYRCVQKANLLKHRRRHDNRTDVDERAPEPTQKHSGTGISTMDKSMSIACLPK